MKRSSCVASSMFTSALVCVHSRKLPRGVDCRGASIGAGERPWRQPAGSVVTGTVDQGAVRAHDDDRAQPRELGTPGHDVVIGIGRMVDSQALGSDNERTALGL